MKILEDFLQEIRKFGLTKVSRLSGVSIGTIGQWLYKGAIIGVLLLGAIAFRFGGDD